MKQNKTVVFLVAAVALLVLPMVLQGFGNAWVRIADMALLYVLLALGLNIVVGYAGLLDLGYVAFFAVGAYMYGLLASPHLTEAFPALARGAVAMLLRRLIEDGVLEAEYFFDILSKRQLKNCHSA